MREDKTKITVKFNKLDNKVTGYFPNELIYPNESFVDTDDIGYVEVTREEWEVGNDKDMIVIDNTFQEYVKTDQELLDEAKISKIAKVKENKNASIYLPIDYNGLTFVNTEVASGNLQSAYTFTEESVEWLDIEGNTITLTKQQMAELAQLMIAHRSSVYFQEANMIKLITASLTTEEVEAVNINFS